MLGLDCRVLFATPRIGRHSLEDTLNDLGPHPKALGHSKALEEIVMLRGQYGSFSTYKQLLQRGDTLPHQALADRENTLDPSDVCNLQFTSGSTGNPKTAILTHQ